MPEKRILQTGSAEAKKQDSSYYFAKKSAKVKIFPVTDFLPKNYCVSGAEKQVRKHEDRYNRTAKISLDS